MKFLGSRCFITLMLLLNTILWWNTGKLQAGAPANPEEQVFSDDSIVILHIRITGNTITSKEIILRELNFTERDTFPVKQFKEIIESSRQQVFNLRLFNFVTIDTTCSEGPGKVDVRIIVVERWYIWPLPFFEISDRNFNAWWKTRDPRRLSYGVDLTFSNVRGRNETLRLLVHFGFNQKFGFVYKMPYINRQKTIGIGFGATIERNHELPVSTIHNEPFYVRNDGVYLKTLISGFATVDYRPDIYSTNTVRLVYSQYHFDSSVLAVPGYAIEPSSVQQFFTINYLFKNDRRDVQYYPLNGYCIEAELNHTVPYTLAHNSFIRANLRVYTQLYNRWYWASGVTGKVSFAKTQPYFLQRGLGYGRDFVRGYEYYVIDGQHFMLVKNNLKFALIPKHVAQIGFIRSTKFNTIPLALYVNGFVDLGYVFHNPGDSSDGPDDGNTLENSFLIGYGLGIDFATYYDVVIRMEGTVNRMMEPGIYLHFIAPI